MKRTKLLFSKIFQTREKQIEKNTQLKEVTKIQLQVRVTLLERKLKEENETLFTTKEL